MVNAATKAKRVLRGKKETLVQAENKVFKTIYPQELVDSVSAGVKGEMGFQGEKGDVGSPGEKGNEGMQGDIGMRGNSGESGLPGTAEAGWLLVVHSQTTDLPSCPDGSAMLYSGYSFLQSLGNGYGHGQDLGRPGSCLRVFSTMPFMHCSSSQVRL